MTNRAGKKEQEPGGDRWRWSPAGKAATDARGPGPGVILAVALNLWIHAKLPGLMRVPFTPALAALTFPMAITATAMLKLAEFHPVLTLPAYLETGVALIVVPFVLFRHAGHFLRCCRTAHEDQGAVTATIR